MPTAAAQEVRQGWDPPQGTAARPERGHCLGTLPSTPQAPPCLAGTHQVASSPGRGRAGHPARPVCQHRALDTPPYLSFTSSVNTAEARPKSARGGGQLAGATRRRLGWHRGQRDGWRGARLCRGTPAAGSGAGLSPSGSLVLPGAPAGAARSPVELDEAWPRHGLTAGTGCNGCRAIPALRDGGHAPGGGSSWDKVQRRAVWQEESLWLWRGGSPQPALVHGEVRWACGAGTPGNPPPGDPVWLLRRDGAGTVILTSPLDPAQNFPPRTAWGAGLGLGLSPQVPRCRPSLLSPGFPARGAVPARCQGWARSLRGWRGAGSVQGPGGCPAPRAGEWHTAMGPGRAQSQRATIAAGDEPARGSHTIPLARPRSGGRRAARGMGGCRLGLGGRPRGSWSGALLPWGTTAIGHGMSRPRGTFGLDPSGDVPAAARRCCRQHCLRPPQPRGEGGQRWAGMRPGLAPAAAAGPRECSWMSALSGCQPHPLPGLSLASPPPASPPSPAPPSTASSCLGCRRRDLLGLR